MELDFRYSLKDLKKQLNSSNEQGITQSVLFDITNLIKGKNYLQYEWQDAIEQILWQINDIEPAEEQFCECDDIGDSDGMFLINHDPNFTNYVYTDEFGGNTAPKPVSKADANKLIDYVANHLDTIKQTMSKMNDSYYKMLLP